MSPRRRHSVIANGLRSWWPLIPAGLAALLALAVLAVQAGSWREQPVLFASCAVGLGAAMLAGLAVVRHRDVGPLGLAWILVVGVALLGMGLRIAPSDDVFRYVVEGRQLLAGQNPFSIPPAAPQAQALVEPAISAGVNHPEMTAIYPPLALGLHAAVEGFSPGVRGFQVLAGVLALACLGVATWLLRRLGRDPALILAAAWNPVLPLFVAGEGHHDIAMALLMLLALTTACVARPWPAVLATGAACLVKPFALALVPALMPSVGWRRWLILPLIAVLAYLPFAGAGMGMVGSLMVYGGERHFHGVLDPYLRDGLRMVVSPAALERSIRVLLVVLLLSGGWLVQRRMAGRPLPERAVAFTVVMFLCLPTMHPWYLVALVVLLPFSRSWALPLWTAGAGIYWLHGMRILDTGAWIETRWVTALAHLPALALLAWECRTKGSRITRHPLTQVAHD